MKTCNYCWRDNVDNAQCCFDCGKPFPPTASQTSSHKSGAAPLRFGVGIVVLLLSAAVLGWLLFMAEHSKRKSSERRSAELEGNNSAHEQSLADAERRLGQTKSKQDSLWENYFLLEEQNKKLQEQNLKWEKQNRDLEKNVAKLEGMLQERQPATSPKRATAIDAALPTDVRLASGAAVQELTSYGNGKLEVDNWLFSDAIIKLVRTYDGQCVAAFYVRSKEKYALAKVPDGSYTLYYATGYDYDQNAKDFKRGRSTKKADSTFDFSTRDSGWMLTGTRINYTLGTRFGNSTSSSVPGAEFDRYQVSP